MGDISNDFSDTVYPPCEMQRHQVMFWVLFSQNYEGFFFPTLGINSWTSDVSDRQRRLLGLVLLGCFSFVRAPMANMADQDQSLKQQRFPSGPRRLHVWDQDVTGECPSEAHLMVSVSAIPAHLLSFLSEDAVTVTAEVDCLFRPGDKLPKETT